MFLILTPLRARVLAGTASANISPPGELIEESSAEKEPAVDYKEAEKVLSEAMELLNQGDLLSALEKVKAAGEITRQVEMEVEEARAVEGPEGESPADELDEVEKQNIED